MRACGYLSGDDEKRNNLMQFNGNDRKDSFTESFNKIKGIHY